jgi:hypothetical protein
MANWNLHERKLTNLANENYCINDKLPLRFFHFSGYKYNNTNKIASYLTRYNFETRTDLKDLFSLYQNKLINNNIENISHLKVFYRLAHENAKKSLNKANKKSLIRKVRNRFKVTINVLLTGRK